jgi:hypothetical protein
MKLIIINSILGVTVWKKEVAPNKKVRYQYYSRRSRVYTMQVGSRESSPGDARSDVNESYGKFDRMSFQVSCDVHYSTCMERLRASPAFGSREPTFIV